jgi:GPH family glycoside/pentoside/hexuronide:cation symporter
MLIYFYLPPTNSGLDSLIPTVVYLGIFSILALIAAGGRLFDAVTDPLIAWMSDRSTHRKGRRIPFMRVGWIPAFLCCIAVFLPLHLSESKTNIITLVISLTLFYLFLTIYFIPYNALMPELARTGREKVTLSTWLSLAYVIGLIIAAQTPLLAHWIEEWFSFEKRIHTFQIAIGTLSLIASVFLIIPVIAINEKDLCKSQPAKVSFGNSLGKALRNYNFRLFLFADFSYFMAIAIIASGMLYYLKVLLGLEEAMGSTVYNKIHSQKISDIIRIDIPGDYIFINLFSWQTTHASQSTDLPVCLIGFHTGRDPWDYPLCYYRGNCPAGWTYHRCSERRNVFRCQELLL